MRSKADQLRALRSLRGALRDEGIGVKLFADEWAITLEDRKEFVAEGATDIMGAHHPNDLGGVNNAVEIIRFSRANGAEPVVGATCCETERSAQLRAHLALATQPSFMLVRAGNWRRRGHVDHPQRDAADPSATRVDGEHSRELKAAEAPGHGPCCLESCRQGPTPPG